MKTKKNKNIVIKKVTLNDIQELQTISRQTFFETFSETNSQENMTKYLEDSFSIKTLTKELTDIYSDFYFAILSHQIIGYLKLNYGVSQTEIKDSNSIEIERIYVLQEYHGQKVGQILYEKALQVAYIKKVNYLWLGVWEENPKAIRFYQKKIDL
ncbi:GNAT superfamily N-acetyltransferase [Myroides gitamensis]|nr:GNAT superfamily N-acetyltransferase [Myroides odoratus]MDH6600347.1 GNAT superfamily N-acetyltransferase [Myroides gitamensis]